jgi:hypothetical protein
MANVDIKYGLIIYLNATLAISASLTIKKLFSLS